MKTIKNIIEGTFAAHAPAVIHFMDVSQSAVSRPSADTGFDAPVPLPNVSAQILSKVIEYCKYHVEAEKAIDDKAATPEGEVKGWDGEFVKVDQGTLFELILARSPPCLHIPVIFPPTHRRDLIVSNLQAANYLNIKILLDLTCLTVANLIKGAEPAHSRCLASSLVRDVNRQSWRRRQDPRGDPQDVQH